MAEKLLVELTPGEEAEIMSIRGGKGIQSRLHALGLIEGQRIRNISRIGWGGPLILLINRAQVAIGRGMARHITVCSLGNGNDQYGGSTGRHSGFRRGSKRRLRRDLHKEGGSTDD